MTSAYLLERAWVDGAVHEDVYVEVDGGRFTTVEPRRGTPRTATRNTSGGNEEHLGGEGGGEERIPGLTLPGVANAHSHVFHRALRGRAQRDGGDFWSWRERMYALAERLDPDALFDLARAAYAEMVAAGFTSVGEFHYLHHQADGTPYADPNATADALAAAAREAGIRLTLLDTCYLTAGIGPDGRGQAPEGVQRRFSDGTAEAWAARASKLRDAAPDGVLVGAAIHSVRAVPRDQLTTVADWARHHEAPLHVHLSEQPAENAACRAAYGVSPTRLLHDAGVLGPRTTVVHATHLTDEDVALLGGEATGACLCPTTERDLADGIGLGRRLHEAGARISVGSDSHAVVDPFEELRAVELDERLSSGRRGGWSAAELLEAGTVHGQASLGYADAGRIAVGQRADLVTVDTTSPRTAGTGADAHTAVFAATAADVTHVMVDGRVVDVDPAAVGRALDEAVDRLREGMA